MPSKVRQPQQHDLADGIVLEKLLDIGQSLIAVRSLPPLLDKIAATAGTILSADVVVVYEYEAETRDVKIPPTIWGKLQHLGVLKGRGRQRPHRDSIVFKVLRRTEPIYASNAREDLAEAMKDAHWDPAKSFVQREGIASTAAVRLFAQNKAVGVLFINYRNHHSFSNEEKWIIQLFATQAATAIQNARFFRLEREQRRRAETLREIARIVNSSLSPDKVADLVLDHLGKVITYTSASVQLIQGDRRIVVGGRGFFVRDSPYELHRNVSDDRLINRIVQQQKPTVLGDVRTEPLWNSLPETANVRSWIGCPLVFEGQVIGLLTLDHKKVGHYTQESGNLVAAFANQVAVAIRNSAQIRTLAKLNYLTEQLIHVAESPKDATEALLLKIAEDALEILSADVIEFYEYDQKHDRMKLPPISKGERRGPEVPRNEVRQDDVVLRLVAEGRPLYIEDAQAHEIFLAPFVDRPEDWPSQRFVFREGILSSAFIPLRADSETMGFMFVSYRARQKFTPERTELVELFANQAAIALKNARLLASLERQVKGHRNLSMLGAKLLERLDEETILGTVARSAADTIDCTHCSVLRVEGDRIFIRAAEGTRGWSLPKDRAFRVGQGVAGWVAKTGEPLLVPDTSKEKRFETGWSAPQPDPLSLVVVPILLERKVYGVISIEHDRVGAFDDQDQLLALTLASQASQAVRITRLHADFELQIQRLKTLNQVSRELSARLEIESIYHAVANAVVHTLDCTHCTFFVLEHDQLVPHASVGKGKGPAVTRRFALGEGLAGQVAKKPHALLLRDAKKHEGFVKGQTLPQAERSLIVVPVLYDDKVIGVISADQDRVNAFDDHDLQMVETLALQASSAIENTRLFNDLQEHAEQLVQLQAVTANVLAEAGASDKALKMIATKIADIFDASSCTIRLYDFRRGQFGPTTASDGSETRPTLPPRPDGTSQYILDSKKAVYAENTAATLPNGQPVIRQESRAKGVESVAYLPLPDKGEVVGRLALSWSQPHHFSETEQHVLELFASQAAATIKIARKNQQLDYLANRKIRDLQAVYKVSQQLTSAIRMSELDILALIHAELKPLMDTKNMYIALYDEATDMVHFPLMYVDGEPQHVSSRSGGQGRTEWIIRNRQSIFIETCDESVNWYERYGQEYIGEAFASWIGVPMMAEDKVLGVIATYNKTEDYVYSKDDQDVLELMASQAAIVLQNARMWEAMQKLSEDLSAGDLLDVG